MLGEPIDPKLVDAFEDGGVLVEGDALYKYKKPGKTTAKKTM